jgi:hypothetical protein
MPNHVTNIISFKDISDERLNEILQAIKNDEVGIGSIDFNKLVPTPPDIFQGNLGPEEEKLYGDKTWMSFNCKSWGTKSNSYCNFPYNDGDNSIKFHTAWSAPHPILEQLTKQYPDVLICHQWSDEDFGCNVGQREYQDGECINENIPMGGTKEAFEMASQIQGYELDELGYRLSEDGTTYEFIDDEEAQQPEEKIKVVLVKPLQKPQIIEIGTSLEAMQETVGGLIEQIMPFDEEVALVCNEEGKIDGLDLNRALKYPDGKIIDIIAGDFFICSTKGENFTSLTDEQAQRYSEMFKTPERFYQTADGIKAVPITTIKNKDYER